jgi:hypothetical protein
MTINDVAGLIDATYMTAQKLVNSFIDLGILQAEKNKQRNISYSFKKYLDILEKEFMG